MTSLRSTIGAGLGATLLAAALLAHPVLAQDPPKPGPRAEHDCAKAPDPARCESRRAEMRGAREACKGRPQGERGTCMAEAMCQKAEDPAKCKARHAERAERHKARHAEREKAREACKGRDGEDRHACMREHRGHKSPAKS